MTGTDLTSKLSAQLSFLERKAFRSLFLLVEDLLYKILKMTCMTVGKKNNLIVLHRMDSDLCNIWTKIT